MVQWWNIKNLSSIPSWINHHEKFGVFSFQNFVINFYFCWLYSSEEFDGARCVVTSDWIPLQISDSVAEQFEYCPLSSETYPTRRRQGQGHNTADKWIEHCSLLYSVCVKYSVSHFVLRLHMKVSCFNVGLWKNMTFVARCSRGHLPRQHMLLSTEWPKTRTKLCYRVADISLPFKLTKIHIL